MRTYAVIVTACFFIARGLYYASGVRFDSEPLNFYVQYADPYLLRTDLGRTLLYFEQQPPLYNCYLGVVLKLFPVHPEIAFHVSQLLFGLTFCLALLAVTTRVGVDRRVAFAIALAFAISPAVVLYENILFYEYLLAASFCCAALFLHRYAVSRRFSDGVLLFACLAVLSGIRSMYHLFWFIAIAAFIGYALRDWRKTILVAAIPGAFLTSFYIKNFVLFRTIVPGAYVQGGMNFASMATAHTAASDLQRLTSSGDISPILTSKVCGFDSDLVRGHWSSVIAELVPRPPLTGVPVLDNTRKTTGAVNYNAAWVAQIAKRCSEDARVAFKNFPQSYARSVAGNVKRYFRPITADWPLDGRPPGKNRQTLAIPLGVENLLTSGASPRFNWPWLHYLAFPSLIIFGLLKAHRSIGDLLNKKREAVTADTLTLIFALFNIVSVSTIVVFFSAGDQNRYRFELSSFYAILFGLLVTGLYKRVAPGMPKRTRTYL